MRSHTLETTVREQRRRRLQDIVDSDGLTVTQSYELAVAITEAQRPVEMKATHGYHVNERGELKPIPGAIVGFDSNRKPVVAPMKSSQPRRRLTVYSVAALAAVDGKANLAQGRVVDVVIPAKDSTPASRTVVTQHQEKSFTFTDGTVMQSCTADGCLWGKGRKTHSDGLRVHESFVPDTDEVEASPDDTQELDAAKFVAVELPKQVTPVAGLEVEEADDTDEDTVRITTAADEAVAEVYGGRDAS